MDDNTKAVIEQLRVEVECLEGRIESLEQENRRLREELEKAQQQMARQATTEPSIRRAGLCVQPTALRSLAVLSDL